MNQSIRILCVDDHPIVREGIALIVQLESDMQVVAQASTGEEAVEAFRSARPDVTLMDLNMPGAGGVEAIRRIRSMQDEARIIVLTVQQGDEDIRGAFAAGATTYLLKETLSRELVTTIRAVHCGQKPVSARVRDRLAAASAQPRLTRREIEVLALVADGLRNKEVAATLGVTEDTIETHLKNAFGKLGVSDRTAAVKVALTRGVLHLG